MRRGLFPPSDGGESGGCSGESYDPVGSGGVRGGFGGVLVHELCPAVVELHQLVELPVESRRRGRGEVWQGPADVSGEKSREEVPKKAEMGQFEIWCSQALREAWGDKKIGK